MSEFNVPADIGNRALDHCGQAHMSQTLGFTENSSRAAAVSFVYGKLRRAELRRKVWSFSIRKAALRPIQTSTSNNTDTLLLEPALWVESTTYFVGSIVADQNGTLWQSNTIDNLGNQPLTSPGWEEYFGPMTVSAWDSATSYFAGELVYTAAGDGTNRVFVSLIEGNSDNPATATAWSATATYYKNQIVTRSSIAYMSLIDINVNQDPALGPALWSNSTTYSIGGKAGGSDGIVYQSVTNGNIGHDPTIDDGTHWTNTGVLNPWTTVFVSGAGSLKWRQIGGAEFPMGVTVVPLNIIYPLGAGPSQQATTRNVFRLPAGYLRKAPQDPKAGSQSWLGAPSGNQYDDWNFEGKYITSRCSSVILLRFAADTVDVATFDDMFCEGLGARIALEVVETLTQSAAKKGVIAQEYARFMGEARTVDAIEEGSVEPPLDDWVSCRW